MEYRFRRGVTGRNWQNGKTVTRTPLPATEPGHGEWTWIALPNTPYAKEGRAWLDRKLALMGYGEATEEHLEHEPERPQFQPDHHVLNWSALERVGSVRVKKSELNSFVHPNVAGLLDTDRRRREESWRPYAPRPLFKGAGPRRRLSLMNSLLLALERTGSRCRVVDDQARDFEVRVEQQRIACRIESTWLRTKAEPEGRERLDVVARNGIRTWENRASWLERRGFIPEEHLREIAAGILVAVELERRDEEQREYEQSVQRWNKAKKELEDRKHAERVQARKGLVEQAKAHRDANDIRVYVAAASRQCGEESEEFRKWVKWALEEADSIDPLGRGEVSWRIPV